MSTYPIYQDDEPEDPVEKTIKDYEGTFDEDGAEPVETPETDPMPLQDIRKPKGPPRHNI